MFLLIEYPKQCLVWLLEGELFGPPVRSWEIKLCDFWLSSINFVVTHTHTLDTLSWTMLLQLFSHQCDRFHNMCRCIIFMGLFIDSHNHILVASISHMSKIVGWKYIDCEECVYFWKFLIILAIYTARHTIFWDHNFIHFFLVALAVCTYLSFLTKNNTVLKQTQYISISTIEGI